MQINPFVALGLGMIVLSLSAMVPLVSLVQSIGRERQIHLLQTLEKYPVSKSLYYQIACNYFSGLEPFQLTRRYTVPVAVLFLVTLWCATITYFGATWTDYLQTPNYILGGSFILGLGTDHVGEIAKYQSGTAAAGSAAFIGAYVYIIRVLLDRINNDDIPPITYYYFAVRILVACLVAGILRHSISLFWSASSDTQNLLLIPAGFVVGLQPDLWIVALVAKVTKYFGLVELQKDPDVANIPARLPLTLIEGLTDGKIARLEELDLDNCQALAGHNPFLIWARTSFQLLHIVDWMAQAQLVCLVKEGGAQKLRAIGIRDIFALANSLQGDSKAQVANTLAITVEMAADMLAYLKHCPAVKRLQDVDSSLALDPVSPAPQRSDSPIILPKVAEDPSKRSSPLAGAEHSDQRPGDGAPVAKLGDQS
jgi:hypothetical protein